MIKYTIINTQKEGLLAASSVIVVQPGDREGTCYIKIAGSNGIKAENTVEEIQARLQAASTTPVAYPLGRVLASIGKFHIVWW